ncbi:MAG: hypothetical protein H6942_01615 [Candidatus Accumulibacter sp.]|uniref:DUF6985 domain-containing protein n=1 Tax=Accumulibacter sp. TaxID=2053492 RepID=UPI0019FECF4F|nr:hypothetical protein [Accumulibacter sp.]MBE2257448.1 hypothetical protein [Paracoccaceae bacterium]MCB1943309.1 hypothetical protein [Accumulibacter sp.]MCP5247231.1 hypothetical protein [Accumulibacter sp.]
MFGFFASPPFHDPQLGELLRARGHWRGSITVSPYSTVPLVLVGARSEPDAQAVQVARQVATSFDRWRPIIEEALFEHYQPYAESLAAGELPAADGAVARLKVASEVWPQVSLIYVAVTPLDGVLTTELAYATSWDEEHTLGARFQADTFIELCGSVLPP